MQSINLKSAKTKALFSFIAFFAIGIAIVKSPAKNSLTVKQPVWGLHNALPATVKTIDKRTATSADGNTYYLVFISKPTVLSGGHNAGHAYVVWGKEDQATQTSYAYAWGLYPLSSMSALTLGVVPGEVRNDGLTAGAYNRLIVKVDKAVYTAAANRMQQWASQGTYQLLTRDCLSFTIDMAGIAKLTIPAREGFDNIPWNYLVKLINAN